MDYNSTKEELLMPEYGRNVQDMIRYARTIDDPNYRQAYIEKVIDLMMIMVPQNRNIDDIREKMWKHVFRIASYDLDALPPSGIRPSPEEAKKKPVHPGYPVMEKKYRHYGHNVQVLIRKALTMEEGPIRDAFVEVIGSYMKMAYKTWNKEHYVSDDVIIEDLKALSDGKLVLHENAELDNLAHANRRRMQQQQQMRNKDGGRQQDAYRHKQRGRDGGRDGGRDNRDSRDSRDNRDNKRRFRRKK